MKAKAHGVSKSRMSHWINRKYGCLHVTRELSNGDLGSSLPCVFCRKKLESMNLNWVAYHNGKWVSCSDEHIPQSKPTARQRVQNFGKIR